MELKQNITAESDKKDLTGDIKDYLNLRIQVIRLNITEKISMVLSGFISGGLIAIFYLLFCLFASAALAFWLGSVFESYAIGFICVGGFYLLIAIVIQVINKSLKSNLTDKFIADLSNDDDERN